MNAIIFKLPYFFYFLIGIENSLEICQKVVICKPLSANSTELTKICTSLKLKFAFLFEDDSHFFGKKYSIQYYHIANQYVQFSLSFDVEKRVDYPSYDIHIYL